MILGQGLPIDTDKDSVFTATLLGGVNEGNDTSPDTQNQGVAQLPKCACRERCQFPELPKATGHHCPGCKLAIHAACGIHDEKAGLDDSNWCYDCWDSKMQQKMPARRTSVVHQQKKKGAMLTSTKKNLLWYLPPLQTMISFPTVHAC